jgi:hypothetical protein
MKRWENSKRYSITITTRNAKISLLLLVDMAPSTANATSTAATQEELPTWRVSGDWFDVCKCNMPCPCEFAQPPTYEECEGILPYHIKKGSYGDVHLDGLNVLFLTTFKGNIWAGDGKTKVDMAVFFDEKANEQQREALNMIFSGKAGGVYG